MRERSGFVITSFVATPIEIPFPNVAAPHLRITAYACLLQIEPGTAEPWVQGSYQDPSGRIELHVTHDADGTELRLGTDVRDLLALVEGPPRLNLRLGTARQFSLSIDAGASENRLELAGVPLTRLILNEGAGKASLSFSAPNPAHMDLLKLGVGAGAVEARGLANAAFGQMRVEGGAAGVQLDFGGTLREDGQVQIATALSGIELLIPADMAAEVTWSSLLGVPAVDAGFTRRDDTYCTRPALAAVHPRLRIHNAAALGGLRLRSAQPAIPVP
jgi:hypothetical protein